MKKRIRLKGRIRTYIQFTLYLGLLLLAIDAAVFMLDFRAGLLPYEKLQRRILFRTIY